MTAVPLRSYYGVLLRRVGGQSVGQYTVVATWHKTANRQWHGRTKTAWDGAGDGCFIRVRINLTDNWDGIGLPD